MSVDRRSGGSGVNGGSSNSISPQAPADRAVGDLLLLRLGWGEANRSEPSVEGAGSQWIKIGSYINAGAPAFGVDAGPRGVAAYYRIADGTSSDNASITPTGSGTTRVHSAVIDAFSKTKAEWAVPEWVATGNTSATTSLTHSFGDPGWGVEAGDFLSLAANFAMDTSGPSGYQITWSGTGSPSVSATFNTAAGGGNDQRFIATGRPATGSNTNQSPSSSVSFNTATYGSSMLVRLRDIDASAIALGVVVVSGIQKDVVSEYVVVGGVKKAIVAKSVIVGGVKKPLTS